jgi:hypothetical protein
MIRFVSRDNSNWKRCLAACSASSNVLVEHPSSLKLRSTCRPLPARLRVSRRLLYPSRISSRTRCRRYLHGDTKEVCSSDNTCSYEPLFKRVLFFQDSQRVHHDVDTAIWTIPNCITVCRMVSTPVLSWLIYNGEIETALHGRFRVYQ